MTQEKSKTQSAVIIGGGVSGLAAAALLAKQGWKVTLLEKNSSFGGRARTLQVKGFQFDMGPSWYLMPEVFEQFFNEFGKKTEDYYSLIRLDPRYKVFFEKNPPLTLADDLQQNLNQFEKIEPNGAKKLTGFLNRARKIYQKTTDDLLYKDIWNPVELCNLRSLKNVFSLFCQFPIWQSWQFVLDRSFKTNIAKQILGFTALFLGGSPALTPSLFSMLAWADFGEGVWYPQGGMSKIIDALVALCLEQGVTLLSNHEVQQIEVEDSKVTGVRTGKGFFPAEVVVGATDLPWLETRLLAKKDQTYPAKYWAKKKLGISALMIYLGLNKRFPKLVHHNLYFTEDWQKNFSEVFETLSVPVDPCLYISVRSVTDRSLVPKNGEEIVILVPLGAKTFYSSSEIQKLTTRVIERLEKLFEIPLKKHLVVKEIFTPQDFADDYHGFKGTALGLAHTPFQSLWGRPRQKSQKVKGLYYAGQYTNPGVGVPTALVSAQILSRMVGFASSAQKAIFKKGSTTYYYSSLFFRGQVKHDVFALYAYVRTIDDFVDSVKPNLKSLEKYWDETVKVWKGGKSDLEIVQQFISLAKRKKFEWKWIEAFWQAMRSDLSKKEYRSYQELEEYMYGSAEVIGLMMAKVLDLPSQALETAALQGKAMQLLNFVRDVAEDRTLGRKYLAYDESCLTDQQKWTKVVQTYLKEYFKLQNQAERGYKYLQKKYRVPIKTAAKMYQNTAEIIERDPMIVWQKKVKPSKWQVILEAIKNILYEN